MIDLAELGTTHPGFRIVGIDKGDESGWSVSGAGDVNGDGFADVLVGSPEAAGPVGFYTGSVHLIFGKPGGFDTIDVGDLPSDQGLAIYGAKQGDHLGSSVSGVGDLNNDGFADILMGAPDTQGLRDSRPHAGTSYVVFGKAEGFGTINLHRLSHTKGFEIFGAVEGTGCGWSLSGAGDFNGDGYADVVIGTKNSPRKSSAFVVFGKPLGFGSIDLASLSSAEGFQIHGAKLFDGTGQSVSGVGDINGDGFADVALGLYVGHGPESTRRYAGGACVLFGRESDFDTVDLASLSPAEGFRIHGAESRDFAGWSVSGAGDVNGDGFADMLIGARAADGPGNTRSGAGESYLIFGKAHGLETLDLADLTINDGITIHGAERYDSSGWGVSGAGDVNADGFADIIIGCPGGDLREMDLNRIGTSYVLFGRAGGFTDLDLGSLSATEALFLSGVMDDDQSGLCVSGAGDVNGDGATDFIVGAAYADSNGFADSGASYVVFGSVESDSATYRSFARSGDAPAAAIGVSGDGSNDSTPDSRCWIDFDEGNGPGNSGSSLQTVTLTRNDWRTAELDTGEKIATSVVWEVETDRTGWSSVTVSFRYVAKELAGIDETTLELWHSAGGPDGPWSTVMDGFELDISRNRICGRTNALGAFTIVGKQSGVRDVWIVR